MQSRRDTPYSPKPYQSSQTQYGRKVHKRRTGQFAKGKGGPHTARCQRNGADGILPGGQCCLGSFLGGFGLTSQLSAHGNDVMAHLAEKVERCAALTGTIALGAPAAAAAAGAAGAGHKSSFLCVMMDRRTTSSDRSILNRP